MDVNEVERAPFKGGAGEEIARPPLVPSERNNAVARRAKPSREIQSRYKAGITSPSLSTTTPGVTRRCPSPNITRTLRPPSPPLPSKKRAQSAERRRASPPASPARPSTPVNDTPAERRSVGGRTSEGLWPSTTTMRSLSVSFQSDTFSLPVSKKEKEKPVSDTSSDHSLRPSANVVRKRSETPQRKATPERKRTPLRGRNDSNQLENAKSEDNSHLRVVEQQRWPSRAGGKVSSTNLARSMDLTDKTSRANSLPTPGRGFSPLRRLPSSDGAGKGLRKSRSEVANRISFDDNGRVEYETYSVVNSSLRSSGSQRPASPNVPIFSSLSERGRSPSGANRSQSMPTTSSRPPSPNKAPTVTPHSSRGLSPSRARSLTPYPSVNSVTNRSTNSSSVLSYITDVKKGKKGANHIEDVHQLRLLYNRYLQWRYANAQADVTLSIQKQTAEETLHNVWTSTSDLLHSVTMKRIELQQLSQEVKLKSVLNEQMTYLDDWDLLEKEYSSTVSGAVEALKACTLRLPVTGGARADVHMVKDAICSAVDVMQAMGSSICSLLSRVEGTRNLISELSQVAAQGRAMLHQCEDLLASTSAMQVRENSLRTHLIQLEQALMKGQHPISASEVPL